MVGRAGGMMRSISDVMGRLAGTGSSSQTTRGRTRSRRGEASSSALAAAEDGAEDVSMS